MHARAVLHPQNLSTMQSAACLPQPRLRLLIPFKMRLHNSPLPPPRCSNKNALSRRSPARRFLLVHSPYPAGRRTPTLYRTSNYHSCLFTVQRQMYFDKNGACAVQGQKQLTSEKGQKQELPEIRAPSRCNSSISSRFIQKMKRYRSCTHAENDKRDKKKTERQTFQWRRRRNL